MKLTTIDTGYLTLVILSAIGLVIMYVETMVAPALTDFIKDFNISYNTVSWILTAYLLVALIMTPVMGKLSDMYGRKRVLLTGLVISAVGTLAAGFATNIYFMLVARAVQGLGIGIFPIAVAIVRNQSPEKRLAFNQGIITSMFASGAVIGLAAGGTVIHYFGWRATFFSILPVVILLIILVIRFIGEDRKEYRDYSSKRSKSSLSNSKLDIKGAILFSMGIVSILLMITNLHVKFSPINSLVIVSLSVTAIISLWIFVYIERRAKSPLVDFKLVTNKVLFFANVLRMIAGLFMFAILNAIPILIRNPKPIGFGEGAINTASIIIPFMAAYLTIGLSSGPIISKLGNTRVTVIGSVVSAIGFITLLLFFHSLGLLLTSLAILGAGSQLLHQGAVNINLVSTPKNQTAISFGISNVFYLMGSAIGPTLVGMYMQSNQISINGIIGSFPSSQAYTMIFYTGIILSIIAILIDMIVMKEIRNNSNNQEVRV
jgi:MFS family permease